MNADHCHIHKPVQIAIGITSCVLSAGIIYGYAALKPLLVEEGVYHHLCRDDELHDNGATVCYRQNLRYVRPYTFIPPAQFVHIG